MPPMRGGSEAEIAGGVGGRSGAATRGLRRHSPHLPAHQVMKIKLIVFGALLVATLGLAGCSDTRRGYGDYGYPSYWGYGGYHEGLFGGERFRGFHGDWFQVTDSTAANSTVVGSTVAVIINPV